jgi:hypothetical protein
MGYHKASTKWSIAAKKRESRAAFETKRARERQESYEVQPSIYANHCFHPTHGECYHDSETGYYWRRSDGQYKNAAPIEGQRIEWIKLGVEPLI